MKIHHEVENQYLNEVLYNTSLNDLPDERWKIIKGMDNYAISNYGRIKNKNLVERSSFVRTLGLSKLRMSS